MARFPLGSVGVGEGVLPLLPTKVLASTHLQATHFQHTSTRCSTPQGSTHHIPQDTQPRPQELSPPWVGPLLAVCQVT